jgi:hypothetical protein
MTMTEQASRGAPTFVASPTAFPDDQLYMLKLCLELQLEALLLALGTSAVASRGGAPEQAAATATDGLPWDKWLTEDLDLACALTRDCVDDGIPLPSSMGLVPGTSGSVVESLAARYSAMAAVVGEMLDRTDSRRHPAAVARLTQTRARCEERLDALIGQSPESANARLFSPAAAGHFLG